MIMKSQPTEKKKSKMIVIIIQYRLYIYLIIN
jgi:hypothetical protein